MRAVTPLALLPRFRGLNRKLAELEARERWPRDAVERLQLERLNRLWRHARSHVAHYRELADQRSLPVSFESLDAFRGAIPLLDKSTVREAPRRFLSDRPSPGRWHRTGGSTGVPMRVYWSHEAHREQLLAKYRAEQARGLDVFDRKVFLWGHAASLNPGWEARWQRIRRPVEDWLRCRRRLSAYRLGSADLTRHLQAMARYRPAGLYGYASAVYLLAREALAQALDFPSLKLVVLTAEPAHPWIIDTVVAAFGAEVMVEYGAVECGVMATQDRDGDLRVREERVLIETVPRSEDGRHELVVTVLNNPSFPLLRYRIGDLSSAPIARPETGFAVLAGVDGRDNDFLWNAAGGVVHPMAVKHVVEPYDAVRRFSAVQRADGALEVQLETDTEIDTRPLRERFGALMGGYPVTVDARPVLESTAAGKHRWVVSEMGAPNRPASSTPAGVPA